MTKEAAVMVLPDDNFSTIVKEVELRRGLYDNLTKYIRFQMGCLFGLDHQLGRPGMAHLHRSRADHRRGNGNPESGGATESPPDG